MEGALGTEHRQERLLHVAPHRAVLGVHQEAPDRPVALQLEADPCTFLLEGGEKRDGRQALREQGRRPRLGLVQPPSLARDLGGQRRHDPEARSGKQRGDELVRHPPCLTSPAGVGPAPSRSARSTEGQALPDRQPGRTLSGGP